MIPQNISFNYIDNNELHNILLLVIKIKVKLHKLKVKLVLPLAMALKLFSRPIQG
jgi:hypothetical protein